MHAAPELFQHAASFDWEALLPVLFFLLYGVAQLFGRKKKQNQDGAEEPEVDAMERARQIREEIRRKIEDRKRATAGEAPVTDARPAYDPTVPDSQQQRTPHSQQRTPQSQQRTLKQAHPRAEAVQPVRTGALQEQQPAQEVRRRVQQAKGPNLEELLAKQRKRVVETRRKQREARAKAEEVEKRAAARRKVSGVGTAVGTGILRTDLLVGLRHPDSIRQAVLYREILDKPLGLR